MSRSDRRLGDLARLSALIKDRELAKVKRIVSHMNRLRGDIDQLQQARANRDADPSLDSSRLSGADVAWETWTNAQLERRQAQLAALRVTHEAALQDARSAFGRADVLARLSDDAADR